MVCIQNAGLGVISGEEILAEIKISPSVHFCLVNRLGKRTIPASECVLSNQVSREEQSHASYVLNPTHEIGDLRKTGCSDLVQKPHLSGQTLTNNVFFILFLFM